MSKVVMTLYGVFRRGVLIASVQKDDDWEWPTIAVYKTRERAEEEVAKMRRPEQYDIGPIEVIE
jgi:hypothetical protein